MMGNVTKILDDKQTADKSVPVVKCQAPPTMRCQATHDKRETMDQQWSGLLHHTRHVAQMRAATEVFRHFRIDSLHYLKVWRGSTTYFALGNTEHGKLNDNK